MRFGSFVLAAAVLLPTPALAQQTEWGQGPFGDRGDTRSEIRCPPAQYVVGLAGGTGTNIDRIQLICAPLGVDGRALPGVPVGLPLGGGGGAAGQVVCSDPFSFANSITVHLTHDGRMVWNVEANCADPAVSSEAGQFRFGPPYTLPEHGIIDFKFGDGYIFVKTFTCPANLAVTGLIVRHGKHVNAVGLICNTIIIPAAPQPPLPARTGRVVTFGKPKVGPPPPPVTAKSYEGEWSITTRAGDTYSLKLIQGDGNMVSGTFTNSDPRKNGTLVGETTNRGRRFNFVFQQPGIGASGNGGFVYSGSQADGYTNFLGTVTTTTTPTSATVWGGKRK